MADSISKATGIPSYEEYVESQKRQVKNELGKNDFLQLLAVQMQYQDPLEPTKDTDFIAQLAQFSSLEQLTNLNETMAKFQYYNLAGKYVYAEVTFADGSKEVVAGLVDRVVYQDNEAYVQVGSYLFKASAITQVYDKDLFISDNPLLTNANLIGKEITAVLSESVKDEETGETETKDVTYSGKVTRVAIVDNIMVAYLDDTDTKVPLGSIIDIRDSGTSTNTTKTETE